VILRREGRKQNPSRQTLLEAAAIAAYHSKARASSRAPVIYTLRKHVRKPRGGAPGLAVCTHEKMVMVKPGVGGSS
jgi:predicted ribosome quality control (RQC) complex YloA/Tae2 family protein